MAFFPLPFWEDPLYNSRELPRAFALLIRRRFPLDKIIKIEVAVLLILVVIAVMVRLDAPTPETPEQTVGGTVSDTAPPPETTLPVETTQPTEPPPPETEPPAVLTFGEEFTLESQHYFVYNCAAENFMALSGTAEDKIYPASITKLFSAYVALTVLEPETVVKVGSEVNLVGTGSSLAYVGSGQRLTVAQLVEGMMLPSGNDAAYALAAAAARADSGNDSLGAQEAIAYFVGMMNETAEDLGLTGSHFANPDGYHDMDHYTSAADLVTIARLALDNELIKTCVSTYHDTVTYVSGQVATWTNTNALINPDSQFYRAEAVGLKTGSTAYAGFCLLSAFEVEGEYIIIGSFGCVRPEDRFLDTLKLYDLVLETLTETEE